MLATTGLAFNTVDSRIQFWYRLMLQRKIQHNHRTQVPKSKIHAKERRDIPNATSRKQFQKSNHGFIFNSTPKKKDTFFCYSHLDYCFWKFICIKEQQRPTLFGHCQSRSNLEQRGEWGLCPLKPAIKIFSSKKKRLSSGFKSTTLNVKYFPAIAFNLTLHTIKYQ